MRRFVPRALGAALLAVSTGCAAGGAGVDLGGDVGGRYLVMIPAFEGPSGAQVAEALRAQVTTMDTHVAINDAAVRGAMAEYDLEQLDEITARQLAQQVQAQLVSWGTVAQGGSGLTADVKFIDTRSGDEIQVDDATGATPVELAAAIFGEFQGAVEGIRQAAFCNDYLSSSQFDRALETCDQALAIVPTSTSALYGRATALLNLERYDEALEVYERLLGIDPTHQDALLGAGLAASRLDRSSEAMTFYNRYLEVNPGNVQVRMTVANDIAQTGDYVSAFRVLETAIDENQDNVDFQKYLFSIATAAGQRATDQGDAAANEIFRAALNAYNAAYSNGEVDAAALRQAIAVNNALGNSAEALRIAEEATERFPNEAQIWSQYATVLSNEGQHAEAAEALTRLIAIDPEYENAYIRRGQAYLQSGNRQQALADLERAAAGGPEARATVAQVLYGVGATAFQAQRYDEAIQTLSTAARYATGETLSSVNFVWGAAVTQQAVAAARANANNPTRAETQRILGQFQRARELLTSSNAPQAASVLDGVNQYIANLEGIMQGFR